MNYGEDRKKTYRKKGRTEERKKTEKGERRSE